MEKLRVLVIGGSGFVGPRLVLRLLEQGHQVLLLNRGKRPLPHTTQIMGDRNDPASLLAARAGITGPIDAVIDTSCYTLKQCQDAWEVFGDPARPWIHLGSSAVYSPLPDRLPHEQDAIGGAPIWGTYGQNKSAIDAWLLAKSGARIVTLRPPYIYGPGNNCDRETFVWSRCLQGLPVLVPGDGSTRIQFLHVDDLAAAMEMFLTQPLSNPIAYNIAHPEPVTQLDFVTCLAAIAGTENPAMLVHGHDLGHTAHQYFPFAEYQCCLDVSAILRDTPWAPYYDFGTGFTQTFSALDPDQLRKPLERTIEEIILQELKHAPRTG